MRAQTRVLAGLSLSLALVATACGNNASTEPEVVETSSTGQTGGEIAVAACTPQKALVPGTTSEACGGDILDPMTAKLVDYDVENAATSNDIAESITTEDNQLFTVKLKPYKFHDGTTVKAKNFVDAWNYTAYAPNGYDGAYFFSAIEGFKDTQCPDTDCEEKPKAQTMSGLKVVDDTTFTIRTSDAVSNLPVRLGYTAFGPLPDSFFDDPKAYAEKPIGAGPLQFSSRTSTEIVLTKFADYSGANPASVDKVTYKIYADPAAAYVDAQGGTLDALDDSYIPQDAFIGDAYKSDFSDRTSQREVQRIAWITFSPNDPQLKDKPDLRKAISRAIDRNLIADRIWNGTVTPATGWVSPAVQGYRPDVCGEACVFDAAAAKAAFEAAGGYNGTLTMTYNADAPNKGWSEAVCNSIKNTLGIECTAVPTVDFKTFNDKIDGKELKGIFRSSWQGDYPSIENFLNPIYGKGADSNWSEYDNPQFTTLTTQAAAAKTDDEATALYQQAEDLLAVDFPTAPLWYPRSTVVWSDRVTNVKLNAFGVIDVTGIQVK